MNEKDEARYDVFSCDRQGDLLIVSQKSLPPPDSISSIAILKCLVILSAWQKILLLV